MHEVLLLISNPNSILSCPGKNQHTRILAYPTSPPRNSKSSLSVSTISIVQRRGTYLP